MPSEYRNASREYEALLADLRDRLGTDSDNVAYTVAQAVLLTFRRRLTVDQALAFADILPAVLRAIFVAGWDVAHPPVPFAGRAEMTEEVRALRRHHNFAPESAIADVAAALRRRVSARDLERVLATLPGGAADFWASDNRES